MSVGATIALGAVLGLALGIIVSVTTDFPSRRRRARVGRGRRLAVAPG